jgi:hypothetical protein
MFIILERVLVFLTIVYNLFWRLLFFYVCLSLFTISNQFVWRCLIMCFVYFDQRKIDRERFLMILDSGVCALRPGGGT